MRLACSFLLALMMICRSMTAVEPSPVYRITGVVVSSVDDAPIARAHLTATLSTRGRTWGGGQPQQGNNVDTDEHGRFSLTLPSPGSWHLSAEASGFVTRTYEQHDDYSCAVVLTAEAPAIDLHFRLPPEAEITGTVIDEAGEAVRSARITLQRRASDPLNQQQNLFQNRMTVQTDDRGLYEFADLAAGDYRVLVDAKPWYALASQTQGGISLNNSAPINPALDVTYQLTWFPGVGDSTQAETISLRAAEMRRADFHLVPIPSSHLQLPAPGLTPEGRPMQAFPMLERLDAGGPGFTQTSIRTTDQGQMDVGGLAPGLYRVRSQGEGALSQTKVIQIGSGSSNAIEAAAAATQLSDITVQIENDADDEGRRRFGVELRNTETGARFTTFDGNSVFLDNQARMNASARLPPSQSPPQTHLQVPPGRYEINLIGRGEMFLAGTSVKGAEVKGRFLTVRAGEATLVLRTTSGYATMTGEVTTGEKKLAAAIVLLVPAGLDDLASFATVLKDESNTDGSFDLNNIVPGPYLLIAVDHGWEINWSDPSTLQHYLTQGVPLEVHAGAKLKQNIEAQAP